MRFDSFDQMLVGLALRLYWVLVKKSLVDSFEVLQNLVLDLFESFQKLIELSLCQMMVELSLLLQNLVESMSCQMLAEL